MIDTTKVKLMTKVAIYENGIGKNDIRMNRWKSSTYISFKVIESLIYFTIGYIILAGLYSSRYFMSILKDGIHVFKQPLDRMIILYGVLFIICWFSCYIYFKKKYREAHKRVVEYDKNLGELDAYLKKENKKEADL